MEISDAGFPYRLAEFLITFRAFEILKPFVSVREEEIDKGCLCDEGLVVASFCKQRFLFRVCDSYVSL